MPTQYGVFLVNCAFALSVHGQWQQAFEYLGRRACSCRVAPWKYIVARSYQRFSDEQAVQRAAKFGSPLAARKNV
jgi:hypothetical protein